MLEQKNDNNRNDIPKGAGKGNFFSSNRSIFYTLIGAFVSLMLLFGSGLIAVVALIMSVAVITVAMAHKGSLLPLVGFMPYAVICAVQGNITGVLTAFFAAALSFIVFFTLKKSGNKIVSVVSGAVLVAIFLAVLLCIAVYGEYNSISQSSFAALLDDIRVSSEDMITNLVNSLPASQLDGIDTDALIASTGDLITSLLYISPGLLISVSIFISYFVSLAVYGITAKGGFLYKPVFSMLKVNMIDAGIFTAATLISSFSLLFGGSVLSITALNFLIIYSPLFAVIGIRNYVSAAAKTGKYTILILMGAMLFFYPLFPIMLLLFGGIRSTVADYLITKAGKSKNQGQ